MKLYRFMSNAECEKLIHGKVLENHTDYSVKCVTASTIKGFCFGIGDKESARKDFQRLKGVVNLDILAEFTVRPERESRFTACQGRYIDYEKIEYEGKTLANYLPFATPHKMFDEYCTEEYSLNDFEEYHVYKVHYDITKDPFGTECLKLRELGIENFSESLTDDVDQTKCLSVSKEIIKVIHKHQDITEGQAMLSLALATSFIFDVIVENGDAVHQQCFDAFVEMLKSMSFSDKNK